MPHVPVPLPRTDGGHLVALGPNEVRAPLAGWDWEGTITARIEGDTVVFEYACTYLGAPRLQRQGGRPDHSSVARPGRPLVAPDRGVGAVPARARRADGRVRARGGRHHHRAEPGADLGAGRDGGGQQRLPQREAAHPRRGRHRRPGVADGPVRRHAARPRRARRRRSGPPRPRLVRRRANPRRQPPDLVCVLRRRASRSRRAPSCAGVSCWRRATVPDDPAGHTVRC